MNSFWDSNVWGSLSLIAVLLLSLLVANMLKKSIPFLKRSLIPTSVLGGILLLIFAEIYQAITGHWVFDTQFFNYNGSATLEIVTYHALALGFIASSFKAGGGKFNKKRTTEIFNSGVTTVATYLIQAILGLGITMLAAMLITGFFPAAGILLPFGFGQGTGQAMNYGMIYSELGFTGGKSFGLTIAALGFLSASIGGVIHLNIVRRKKKIDMEKIREGAIVMQEVQGENEVSMNGSMDKLTIQVAFVIGAYMLAYLLMSLLGMALPGMRSTIFGFNFLLGVIAATLIKAVLNFCQKKKIMKRQYINNFLMTRISNFCFDVMVISGIAAIRLSLLEQYWGVILILGIVGMVSTYLYNRYVARKLFAEYQEEQFLVMYGMLTGTASTGIILLREIDGQFKTPAADNLVYQQFPAIVFGFPMMLLANMAPGKELLTLGILIVFFIVMNIILFRSFIFRRKKKED